MRTRYYGTIHWLRVIGVGVLLGLLFSLAVSASDWQPVSAAVEKKIVRLEMETNGEPSGSCSAVVFAIEDGQAEAVTAAHCVSHPATARFDLTANRHDAVVAKFNTILDLAIVTFHAKHEEAITLAPQTPPMGAEVSVVGYAFGIKKMAAQFGRVAQPWNDETEALWLNVDLIFGDSGGAAIDDQGRLIGINSRIYSGGFMGQMAHIAAVVPVEAVTDFITAYQKGKPKK